MHPNFKKWLAVFLSGRQAYTEYNDKPFTTRHYTNGVQQGSVLSPTSLNLYMHNFPAPLDLNTRLMSYTDDLTVTQQHPKHETTATNLQAYINQLEDWQTTNKLMVSPNKSSLTLIIPYKKKYLINH